ncbi:MAG: DUF2130 domain-containing protein [Chloroflexi bacterium]|nr:DUF2130 domain-containing protein [Chloroflexota bacterium]
MMNDGNNNMADSTSQQVECPRCGKRFELSETFRAHFEAEMRKEFDNALRDSEARIRAEAEQASQAERAESEKQVKDLKAQLQTNQEAQEKREAEIRVEAEKANQAKLAESAKQVEALQAQLQADQEAREKRETEFRVNAEKKASSEFDIKRGEWDIEKQRLEKQMAEMQRQLGQRTAELQGEALETYLKQKLQTEFPFDAIEDIGRGQRGADMTQTVNDARLGTCGMLVWEAKRTKHWNDSWIEKIKQDADRVGAHLRIIVSEALPADIGVFALKKGVWVCSIEGAIPLANALRAQLIESARLQRAAQGKNVKMDEIYQYLTSPRFGERIQRMVETWNALEKQVISEERSMQRQWKERRKQLAKMQDTTIEMFTDFSHILGQEIAQVPGLELEALPPGDNVEVIEQ